MEFVTQLMRSRKSIRSFDGQPVRPEIIEKLARYAETIRNPYGIPVQFKLLDAADHGLSSPVLTGEKLYVGAKLARVPHAEEALGYSMEQFLLYAQSLGLGSVWIGGTMNRSVFERAMCLNEGEFMPCVSPLGVPAKKPSLRESMMRRGVQADRRNAFESMFFEGAQDIPLPPGHAGVLAEALEMVRLGPSAVNKQPWRVIVTPGAAHFYLKPGHGFTDGPAGNMQKIDMGIALCHFALAAEESGLSLRFALEKPALQTNGLEYIASYHF